MRHELLPNETRASFSLRGYGYAYGSTSYFISPWLLLLLLPPLPLPPLPLSPLCRTISLSIIPCVARDPSAAALVASTPIVAELSLPLLSSHLLPLAPLPSNLNSLSQFFSFSLKKGGRDGDDGTEDGWKEGKLHCSSTAIAFSTDTLRSHLLLL
ncbi:hypothetical protein Ahy_Scaffold8g108403 isoform J [Arachis hypogaea]|uniref:Uncharacterized protein n=1 Tax=Arachis hypogaea TaxID=3818 RepID=A0A444WNV3_ARAHY|nr:hypothetical protein Ahy_Scaffold8g108403 isoform J [Arachis hypogaea]